MSKVIIEDLVARMEGKKEKMLPEGTTIRFITSDKGSISVTEKDGDLHLYKRNVEGINDVIAIIPQHSNKVIVK